MMLVGACAMIAREATGKRKILVANGAYHGAVPWCNPYPNGATAEDRVHLIRYDYNDVASLERAGLFRLLERRELWEQVCADPSLAEAAVEESLRFDSPRLPAQPVRDRRLNPDRP